MEDHDEKESKTDCNLPNLLYPELMSQDELIQVLEQRYIQNEDLSSLSKEGLIELYYRYVIPLPQRKYRLNRRGREMTKKQIVMAKKRKLANTDVSEPPKKKSSTDASSRLLTSFSVPSTGDRLKPPPSCIDFSKKKISLNSKNKIEQNLSAQLQDTSLHSDNDSLGEQTLRKNITKITLNSSHDETITTNDAKNLPKKIKLNSSSQSGDKNNSCDSAKKIKLNSPTSQSKDASFKSTVSLINKHLGGSTEKCKEKSEIKIEIADSKLNSSTEESPKKKQKIAKISWP